MNIFVFITILCVFVVAIVAFCDICIIQAGKGKYKVRENNEIQTMQREMQDNSRRVESWENLEKKENTN